MQPKQFGIIELEDRHSENTYVGRKDNMVEFVASQLYLYFEGIPSSEDLDYDHLAIIRETTNLLMELSCQSNDEIIMVENLLFENPEWYHAEINVKY